MKVSNAKIYTQRIENSKNKGSISINSQKKSEDNLIEKLNEQIKKISENEHYDEDMKKTKIKEIEKQIKEIENLKKQQEAEALNKDTDISKNDSKTNTKNNKDGDTLEVSNSGQFLLRSELNLKKIKSNLSSKNEMENESNILKSEINVDSGRGVDTTKKESKLLNMKKNIENIYGDTENIYKDIEKTIDKTDNNMQTETKKNENDSIKKSTSIMV